MAAGRLDRRRLVHVTDRFRSPYDGERLAALEAAARLLEAGGSSWANIIGTDPDDQAGDTDHRSMCAELLRSGAPWLTQWEADFLVGLLGFDQLSPRQAARLDDIRAKVARAHRAMAEAEFTRPGA